MQNVPMEFAPAYLRIKVTHMSAADLNVLQMKSVQKIKPVWKTNAKILVLEFVVEMLYVRLPITFLFACALQECLEIHLSLVSHIKVVE